jgi:hypothetical protein
VQIFIEGLKPKIKNEMIKISWVPQTQAFNRAEELEQLAELKAMSGIKINETSVYYVG